MDRINQFLIKMPRLIHLELGIDDPMDVCGGDEWKRWSRCLNFDIESPMDIIDGYQWKYLVSHLQKFDFYFYLSHKSDKQILHSFQSPFWLEEKQWFVAYDGCQSLPCIFTIPRFAPKSVIYSSNYCTPSSTSSDLCLDRFVEILTLPMLPQLTHHFINVTSLIVKTDNNITVDKILPYLQLPRVQSLSLVGVSSWIEVSTGTISKSIRSLRVNAMVIKSHAEQICVVFPRLERLQVEINDTHTMLLLIDKLTHLSIATFIHRQSSSLTDLTYDWFVQNSLRLTTNNNFTYDVNGNVVHLWIGIEHLSL